MKSRKIKKIKQKFFLTAFVGGTSVFLLFFIVTCFWIGRDVKNQCQEAQRAYEGDLPAGRQDCVEALIKLLNDEQQGFRARNSAIWALGQLGDRRALPMLQKYYTGNIPAREPLDKTISQYELKKAINLAGGGFNITAFVWNKVLPVSVIATYKGTLPCADCPGIDATLTLYKNNTFSQIYVYKERNTTFTTKGTWNIKKDIPKNISFPVYEFIEKGAANAMFYGAKDNQLVPLDSDLNSLPAPYNAPLIKQ